MALRPNSPEFIALTKFPLVVLRIEDQGDQLELIMEADQRYHILVEKQEPEGTSCPDELYRLLLNLERSHGVAQVIDEFREGKPIQFPVTFP